LPHRAPIQIAVSKNRPLRLLDGVEFDLCETRSNHSQRISRGVGDIDNSSGNVRIAVVGAPYSLAAGRSTSCDQISFSLPRAWQHATNSSLGYLRAAGVASIWIRCVGPSRRQRQDVASIDVDPIGPRRQWSPEQIAGWLKRTYSGKLQKQV
jgi:hypothetical protein